MNQFGTLYIVATPIGHPDDITLRAIETLKAADAVVCEEYKPGSTLLKKLGIEGKELILLNEHNEAEVAAELLTRLLNGQSLALFSDCGTPVFSDPGHYLIQLASSSGVKVSPIPGASSLMAALSVLDFHLERFMFAGFLPRDPDVRRKMLTYYRTLKMPLVVRVTVAFDMTLPTETIYRGEAADVRKMIGPRKGEFIMIIGNMGKGLSRKL
ncbi:Ribosomal RNA small subunit methyltransferase I [bioreactor metagenome]|uniref:Ribosomal RNA small subunit methyltransferase I n=1 Tax=bioreactor metagenome TaxID=1076179 RepID=A0A645D509_9ZZZZ